MNEGRRKEGREGGKEKGRKEGREGGKQRAGKVRTEGRGKGGGRKEGTMAKLNSTRFFPHLLLVSFSTSL